MPHQVYPPYPVYAFGPPVYGQHPLQYAQFIGQNSDPILMVIKMLSTNVTNLKTRANQKRFRKTVTQYCHNHGACAHGKLKYCNTDTFLSKVLI